MGARAWLQQGDSACHAGRTEPPAFSRGLQNSALGLVGMVLRAYLEEILHLPDSPTTTALSGAEYGLKLGSQLFIKHIVESGLAAKGSSLQEGDLILKVCTGCTALIRGLICPFGGPVPSWCHCRAQPQPCWTQFCLVPTPCPSPPGCPRDPAGLSGPSSLRCQGWWHVLLPQWGRVPTG